MAHDAGTPGGLGRAGFCGRGGRCTQRRTCSGAIRLRPAGRRLRQRRRSRAAIRRYARAAASAKRTAAPGAFPIPRRRATPAMCFLKREVVPRTQSDCCVSGVRGAGVIEPRAGAIEYSIDRYRRRLPVVRDAAGSQGQSLRRPPAKAEKRCRAWTYRRPGYGIARRALLPQGDDQAAAPPAVLHFGRRAIAPTPASALTEPR